MSSGTDVQKGAEDYQKAPYDYRDWHRSYYEIYTDFSDDNRKMLNDISEKADRVDGEETEIDER